MASNDEPPPGGALIRDDETPAQWLERVGQPVTLPDTLFVSLPQNAVVPDIDQPQRVEIENLSENAIHLYSEYNREGVKLNYLLITRAQVEKLRDHSDYFQGLERYEDYTLRGLQARYKIVVPSNMDGRLASVLLQNICDDKTEAPVFTKETIGPMIELAFYFTLNTLLNDICKRSTLSDLNFCSVVRHIFSQYEGNDGNLVKIVEKELAAMINDYEYAAMIWTTYKSVSTILQDRLAFKMTLTGLARSVAVRAKRKLDLCAVCGYASRTKSATVTQCCFEPIHHSCLERSTRCKICHSELHGRMMPCRTSYYNDRAILRDAKLANWTQCNIHHACKVHYTYEWALIIHKTEAEFNEIVKMDYESRFKLHKEIYEEGYRQWQLLASQPSFARLVQLNQ